MPPAHELFWNAAERGLGPGDRERLEILRTAASIWREQGKHFNAGYAMSWAVLAAWGDGEQVDLCIRSAVQDFNLCVETQPAQSHESFAALIKWHSQLENLSDPSQQRSASIGARRRVILEELAQRLITHYIDSPNAENYLIRGLFLTSDLQTDWEPSFPPYEVQWGTEQLGQGVVRVSLPSAFRLLVSLGDYQAANAIVGRLPDAFTTPGLRGWKAAVQGFVDPDDAPDRFEEAANAFAEDQHPTNEELMRRGGFWSSVNVDLWSKYFRSRAALATVSREPGRVRELIQTTAAALEGTDSGWGSGRVSRFRILLQTLARLIGEPGLDPRQARQQFLQAAALFGEEAGDDVAVRFLSIVAEAFDGFKVDPAGELTTGRLRAALDALARIPLIGPDVARAFEHPIGASALDEVLGPIRTWIYRTLESIRDEGQLRRIVLRLAHASIPLYAQILHGPIEYGRDVVVLLQQDGRRLLRMYQVKTGDITVPIWRDARQELEDMFLVPMPTLHFPGDVEVREGILLCNGHANPHVIPVIEGWFQEQERAFQRRIRFMGIDDMVQWIVRDRLINEFRRVLAELGLEPVPPRTSPVT